MNLGEFVKQHQAKHEWDMVEFANRAHIDQSTLSRVINGRVTPSAATFISICSVLDVDVADIYEQWGGNRSDIPHKHTVISSTFISRQDVDGYRQLLSTDPAASFKLMARLINLALPQGQDVFAASQIAAVSKDASPVEMTIVYPLLPSRILQDTYANNGLLTIQDAGAYIRSKRLEEDISLKQLKMMTNLAPSVLQRFEEGQTERIRFDDILVLDRAIGKGYVFAMFWTAFTHYNALKYAINNERHQLGQDEEYQQILMLINGFRWLQYHNDGRAESWLISLREMISSFEKPFEFPQV